MTDLLEIDQSELEELLADGEAISGGLISDGLFDGATMVDAQFVGVRFVRCRFSEAELVAAQFEDCKFVATGFARADLTEATFERCNFFDREGGKGTDFSYSQSRETRFLNCNLSASKFVGAELFDIAIRDSKANGTKFSNAQFARSIGGREDIVRGQLLKTIFDDSDFAQINMEGMQLAGSSFCRADMSGVILADADMAGCDIAGANLNRANLERTDLRRAQLGELALGDLSGYHGMKISEDQQSALLEQLGIQVFR